MVIIQPYFLYIYVILNFIYAAPSSKPLSLIATNITSRSITLQWKPPPEEYCNGIIRSYVVVCHEKDSNGTIKELSSKTVELTVNELHPFLIYGCKVAAVTVSQGPYSDTIYIPTLEDGKA